jgi:hypothetical protein
MGSYQCKKCSTMLDYYNNSEHAKNNSCRIHSYVDIPIGYRSLETHRICNDCGNVYGNCKHIFKFVFCKC